jgi:hypothetical protein
VSWVTTICGPKGTVVRRRFLTEQEAWEQAMRWQRSLNPRYLSKINVKETVELNEVKECLSWEPDQPDYRLTCRSRLWVLLATCAALFLLEHAAFLLWRRFLP